MKLFKPRKNISTKLRGEFFFPVNQLWDPYVFMDKSGNFFLIYKATGENSTGIVELKTKNYE